jgi:hypothetical protein
LYSDSAEFRVRQTIRSAPLARLSSSPIKEEGGTTHWALRNWVQREKGIAIEERHDILSRLETTKVTKGTSLREQEGGTRADCEDENRTKRTKYTWGDSGATTATRQTRPQEIANQGLKKRELFPGSAE